MMALLFALACSATGARADDRKHDQDMVRQAVERGEIKTLADILTVVRNKLPGEVVRVKIEQKRSRWYYELRVADAKGRLFEVYVDAQTGAIERVKEK
jgi:uncharacterized membrane protein YkoI